MSKAFINRIEQVILLNLENDKFGVIELAAEMNLSRSQLLRKVKSFTGKSASRFIREIRLKQAVNFLLKSDQTASEIAYKTGFSSPSYFNKCFLDEFGKTPVEFKKNYENDDTFNLQFNNNSNKKKLKLNLLWTFFIGLIAISLFYYLITSFNLNRNGKTQHTSIAVLPLDDYSENKTYDYLASGITEAINLELSKNKSIRVISRGSSERFKGNKKLPYNEIAKELGVNLLLEGSVFPNNDSLLVVVQLIKPFPNEKHIWSNKYHRSSKHILQLVQSISGEIAHEIYTSLNIDPPKSKIYKVNSESYNLYLKGRLLWNNQKTRYQSLINAQEYLEESIKIDPNFAPSYVILTEINIALNKLTGDNQQRIKNRENARKLIDIAFDLDNSMAEAYITKGNLVGKFDWTWGKMKELALKGLELDPSNAMGHQILSNYHIIKGNYKKAIDEALIAQKLDPLNPVTGTMVAERYYIAGEFEKSISKYKEVLEIDPDYGFALNGIGYVYLKNGNRDKAFNSWRRLQTIMKNDSLGWYYDNNKFDEGLYYYLDKAKVNTSGFCSNPVEISSVEMIVGDKQAALEYLKIAYNNKGEDLPIMITYPDFKPLYDNQEFIDLIKKMGVIINN